MSNGDQLFRKSHIKRIYQNDDPSSGQWIDIERLDELRFVSKRQFPWREKRWSFDWDNFDPDGNDLDGNPIQKKKIKQNPDDSDDDAIEVPVRDMVFVTTGREQQFQGYKHYFVNDDSNTSRETHLRRVYHHDIPDDALDDNGDPPRDPNDYINVASADKDKDQFVEVEMLDEYWTNERETRDAHGNLTAGRSGIWQEKKWLIDSSDDPLLFDESTDDPDFASISNPDAGPQVDPPWRLDPLQNIVNVSWKGFGAIALLANEYSNQVTYYKKTSKDKIGEFQALGFLQFTENGTVRGCSYAKVKNKDTDETESVFLLCGDDGSDIIGGNTAGIIMLSNDGLNWSKVAEVPNMQFQSMTWNPGDPGKGENPAFFCETQDLPQQDPPVYGCWTSTDGHSWKSGGGDFNARCKYGDADGLYGFDPSKGEKGHLVMASDLNVGNLTFAGGVWLKTEGINQEELHESTDDTTTWKMIRSFGDAARDRVFPLIAGSWQDVKAWKAKQFG